MWVPALAAVAGGAEEHVMNPIGTRHQARPQAAPTCEGCQEAIDTPCLLWCELLDGEICVIAIGEDDKRPLTCGDLYRHWHTGCLPRELVPRTALAA